MNSTKNSIQGLPGVLHLLSLLTSHFRRPPRLAWIAGKGGPKIRINGRLGVTALSAFPSVAHQVKSGETELTGFLEDSSELFGILPEVEALGLELLELREIPTGPKSPECGDDVSPEP